MPNIDAEDGATIITDTLKEDTEPKQPKTCVQQTLKVSSLHLF